jgi:hypothetical protein
MFKKLLGKKKDNSTNTSEVQQKIEKMNLSEMRTYLKNHIPDLEVCEDGVVSVLERLNSIDSSKNKFVEDDAMDSKKKKLFELVIVAATHKKVSAKSVELIQHFIDIYTEMITDYDKRNKQIYMSRLNDALNVSVNMVNHLSTLKRKTNILGD